MDFSGIITSSGVEKPDLPINQNCNIEICAFQVVEY